MQTADDTDKQVKPKHPGGRPTKYTPEVIRKAKDYIENYESYGDVIPSIAGLAVELDLNKETITNWAKDKNKSEFSRVVTALIQGQERKLLNGGLDSVFNPGITRLILSKHGYHDNPQANQAPGGITVNVNRGGVVIKSGGETLAIETDEPKGVTIDHE